MTLETGSILNNRYRIEGHLGKGGMGTVYLAYDQTLELRVALKENLNPHPESEQQFRREAKLLASLRHPNLPRVTDHFILSEVQYLVMDYIEGEDL
ncbi:MAG TPA: protein kinase, partial [Anaerolineales bacterium]|nr:protein kinase [Anaerolineales bacterium]